MKNKIALTRRNLLVGGAVLIALPVRADYVELTAQEAAARLAADPSLIVLDIRTAREFHSGHIEGAINVDFYANNFIDQLAALEVTRTYIVHCAVGGRSRAAERAFAAAGITNVLHMTRGIEQWRAQGLPLVRP